MFYFIYREIITVFCIDSACPLAWFEPRTADNEHPYPTYKKNYEFCSIKKVFFFNFLIFFKICSANIVKIVLMHDEPSWQLLCFFKTICNGLPKPGFNHNFNILFAKIKSYIVVKHSCTANVHEIHPSIQGFKNVML